MGITATEPRGGRLLAVSDIHGHQAGLSRLLQLAGYDPKADRLLLLGDYIDADKPTTWTTLALIRQLAKNGARAIAGNHELKFASLAGKGRIKSRRHVKWIRKLPLYTVEEGILFVHAGLRPQIPLLSQSARDLTEIREAFYKFPANAWSRDTAVSPGGSGHTGNTGNTGNNGDGGDDTWRRIVFGHTATSKLGAAPGAIWTDGFRIAIDTGAKQGMRLTLVDFTGKLAYSCRTGPGYGCSDFRTDDLSDILRFV